VSTDSAVAVAFVEADVTYQIEDPADLEAAVSLWQQIIPIMAERIGKYNYQLGFKLSPDWEGIAVALVRRQLIMLTAKRGDTLLGYQLWMLNPYTWEQGKVVGISVAVNGGYRKGVDARRLATIGINYLKALGVHALIVSAPRDSAAAQLWQDLGLEELEVMYGMNLWPASH
jgi:hypothetical protein